MGLITIVRHGQATIDGDDYDRLSELGHHQAARLGEWMSGRQLGFDRVLTGPLRRHRETHAALAEAMVRSGSKLPDAEEMEELTEHQAIAMMEHVVGPERRKSTLEPVSDPSERKQRLRQWFETFDRTMRQWIRQEIQIEHLETWQQARQRAGQALDRIIAESQEHEDVLVISSGGFLSMAVGHVWRLDDETVYELSLEVLNTGWAELRHSRQGLRVRCFNWHPHIDDPSMLTLV